MPVPRPAVQPRALVGALAAVLAAALLAGCTGEAGPPVAMSQHPAGQAAAAPAAPHVAPLSGARLRADVLVAGTLTSREMTAVRALSRPNATFTTGVVTINRHRVRVASVDVTSFRRFAAAGTAESTALWQAIADGQLVASHAVAKQLRLPLGGQVPVRSVRTVPLRLGGLATTGVPSTDLLVNREVGKRLGFAGSVAVVLSAGRSDPVGLAARARRAAGEHADVDLLTAPAASPVAFLTGSKAARAFGAFSYRYYPDGTIVPDARWVRQSIVTARVPILGTVTCHRLMVRQLRGALQDVVNAGLASKLHTYNGCYVPRFMEHDPKHPVSLHTWGIAIDLDAASNGRGTSGTMDPRVVQIFKRWGFRWGGDWSWTDPMHFELGALLK
jgi:hypothetical protein